MFYIKMLHKVNFNSIILLCLLFSLRTTLPSNNYAFKSASHYLATVNTSQESQLLPSGASETMASPIGYVPKWVAPNSMTFMGFMLLAGNFLLMCWLDYGYSSSAEPPLPPDGRPVPNWCWLLMGVSLFVAYTLDGIDGKQARRTGSSGPLGELFDHGLDSYAAALVPVCLYSCFGRYDHSISTWRMFLVLWNILVSFYLSHWEKYITGVLFLPWGYDFGMLSSSLVFLATGMFGHTIWKSELPFGYNSGTLFEMLIYLTSLACNMPVTLWNIHKAYRDKSGKGYGFMEATRPLWALVMTIALTTFWVAVSPGNILNRDPRAVYLLMGTLFSNVSCRLIVAQMSNTRCEASNPLLLPLLVSAVLSLAVPRTELALLYAMCLLALASHIHYGTCVVRQMCRHFKVDCFRIKYKK